MSCLNPQAIKQNSVVKKIEKALEDAGLGSREVTPFMRVRVVELTQKGSSREGSPVEGMVAIWNPTEQQVSLSALFLLVSVAAGKSSCVLRGFSIAAS